MKMVRHHNKLMQQILLLLSVTEQDFDEQLRNFLNLEQVSPRLHICGDKVCGLACFPSMRNCQKSPQRLKPSKYLVLPQELKSCSTPRTYTKLNPLLQSTRRRRGTGFRQLRKGGCAELIARSKSGRPPPNLGHDPKQICSNQRSLARRLRHIRQFSAE